MIKKYEGFLNFFKKRNDDTSEIINSISDVVNTLNDLPGVEVLKTSKKYIIKSNDIIKMKIRFAVSTNEKSMINLLKEIENVNSQLLADDFICELYFLSDEDMDGTSGYKINMSNYKSTELKEINTSPDIDEQVPGLYLIVKNVNNKSSYIFN
jgi:hypothetical protein